MAQWIVKASVNGVEQDVTVNSDAQPVVFQNPANSSGTQQQTVEGVITAATNFLTARSNYLAQEQAQLQKLPPVIPNGPVPATGYTWWVRTGFVQNVPGPYQATDLGLGVILIWAPTGTATPAQDYSVGV